MNHLLYLVRLIIITFWLVVVGLFYSVISMGNNMIMLGWPTMLMYGFITIIVVYVTVILTTIGWNKFK